MMLVWRILVLDWSTMNTLIDIFLIHITYDVSLEDFGIGSTMNTLIDIFLIHITCLLDNVLIL